MIDKRVGFSNIVRTQLPEYVREEFPLISEFLSQYYISQEYQGAPVDLIQNIDQYVKVDEISETIESVTLKSDINFEEETIEIDLEKSPSGTKGFPKSYGLIKIDDEIITYTGITSTSFVGCIRGFSGIDSYKVSNSPDILSFKTTNSSFHKSGSVIINLSSLFLKEFLVKTKYQLLPGFESRELYDPIKESTFIKQAKDFYSSKGSDNSFKILFNALYGKDVAVLKPKDNLIRPSDANYEITNDFIVESIEGNPINLIDSTLIQDDYQNYTKAYAPITNVQKIQTKTGETYYRLSIDSGYSRDIIVDGSTYGQFLVHPKTKAIEEHSIGSTIITVDSTIGFSDSGELYVEYEDSTFGVVSYTSKSVNQFYGCSNIIKKILDKSIITVNTFAYGESIENQSETIKVRILSVVDDIILNDQNQNFYHLPKTEIAIKTLGANATDYISNNWLFNISPSYKNISFEQVSSNGSNYLYRIKTNSKNIFEVGDSVEFSSNISSEIFDSSVIQKNDVDLITVQLNRQLSNSSIYSIRRKLSKTKSVKYPDLSNVVCNVQNTYNLGESIFVASNSLPAYTIETDDLSVSGQFTVLDEYTFECGINHPFSNGDIVYYTPNDNFVKLVDEGIYNVKKVSSTQLKFSKGNSNLNQSNFVSLQSTSSGKIEFYDLRSKSLKPQNLLRNISSPIDDEFIYTTVPGKIGILKNGVEILNYKSEDKVLYGGIESIDVLSPGNDYDVINPPDLIIEDSYGTGAKGYCSVEGSLSDIRVLDSGFDYIETPQIKITGGNGSGAVAIPNIKFVDHILDFNSENQVTLGSSATSKIGFSTYHKFRNGEKVFYKSNGFTNIGGLVSNSSYYITTVSPTEIKLHKNLEDTITGVAVSFTSYGIGKHSIKSSIRKVTLGSISILNSGSGYQNKKRTVHPAGINTSLGIISINNHGFKSGEIVRYKTEGTSISGLTNDKDYILTSIDENRFSLSEVGTGSTNINFYFNTKNYINLNSAGIGTHTFNYPPISVEIIGKIGVSTIGGLSEDTFKAKILADFKGSITSVHISDNGVGYGSSDIINFDRQPSITTFSGSGAVLKPIVNEGKIVDVLVISQGKDYISAPILSVVGAGSGAVLVPILENKKITSVKIIQPGFGYEQNNTSISIRENGSGVRFYARLQNWNINLVERFKNYFKPDDGFITKSLDTDKELQYTHLYCPRNLIESESTNKHSPIIGWAYDGNPIYGPYAYLSRNGISGITRMRSSYELISSNNENKNRPSSSNFPLGFFIEDYEYLHNNKSEFLDENNGRFCITPEFPLGTYAYFSTLDSIGSDSFSEYKNPVFPYFIGNSYKSKPNNLNFSSLFDQSQDINSLGLIRNTSPYGLLDEDIEYTYLNNQNYRLTPAEIKSVSPGIVESIQVTFGGDGYKVNDSLSFDNTNTKGFGAYAKVTEVEGKGVQSISVATTSINNIEFYANPLENNIIGISQYPHGLKNDDLVSIVGINSSYILDSYRIGVSTNSLVLSNSTGSSSITGLITYFSVYGQLNLNENDILNIESERVKILKIDRISSRIKVLREIDGTVGSAHSASTLIYEDPRKFIFKDDRYFFPSQNRNKEIYFSPIESLGIGTQSGVGIGKTLVFSNPGAGITQIFIPTRTIYLPNHQLETGDELIYNIESGGTSILVSTNGVTNFTLADKSKLYTAKISNDLIGISTVKVGLGTTGSFVGITTQTRTSSILYFTGVGIGSNHSFKTNYNVTTGKVLKNLTTVILDEDPKLNKGDSVTISVNPSISTSISIKYNDYNKRLVTNTLNFSASGINTTKATIEIINHNLENGQKVIYNSISPPAQLTNNGIYFVSLVDENTIQLSDSFYNSTAKPPITLGISTASNGSISLINPPIKLYKNSTVTFNLSDSSLSYTQSGTNYSAFDFNIYKDSSFTEPFDKLNSSTSFDVEKIGLVGIDASAKLILNIKEDFPQKLYYKLTPITKNPNLPNTKKEIVIDYTVSSNNTLEILDSFYNGKYFVSSSSTNSFTYFTQNKPESVSYSSTSSTIKYTTNSLTSNGPISKVQVTNGGRNYFALPKISKINSISGSNAILEPSSQSIGKIKKVNIKDLGFDFSADYTLKPTCYSIINATVDPLYSFESIGITSYGTGYISPPKLIVIDGRTQEVIDDLDLEFNLDKSEVTILKNTFGLSEIPPKIIPIQNTNGVGINSISYDPANKNVTVVLSKEFDNLENFPFSVGDKILIENVYIEGEGEGYNSKDYNYSLFEINAVYANIGIGFGEIVYSLENFLENNQTPGKYSSLNSFGRVILEKHFPSFSSKLTRGEYLTGERLTSNSIDCGKVSYWNSLSGLLLITESNTGELISGKKIKGVSSNIESTIKKVFQTDLSCSLGPKSSIINGWKKNIGFLNDDSQKIQDSFYYQNFSYSLKSEVSYDTWSDAILTLNHPRGFKVFSDYQLESENYVGLSTQIDESNIDVVIDIISITDTNTYYNFGSAKETNVQINSNLISDEIIFDNKILSDYILSVGNKVISIDDISLQFDNVSALRRNFNLTSNNEDIFKRVFDASSSSIVDINSNTIKIQNHFFVTGEKLFYSNGSNSSTNSIGIGTTDFGVGIGLTNKLPEYVYAVKVDDTKIKLARNAEDSLSSTPKTLDFVSLGIGLTHYFASTNQNSRVLISIDNIIQSPIVSTAVTTQVLQNITGTSSTVYFSNTESFFSGDLVKINNEIMKVYGVGIGSTNSLNVNRAWMGTNASSHLAGDVAIKIIGDYNIIENTINFSDSPYGETLKETAVEASATTSDPSFSYSISERFDSTIITFDHTGRTFDMDF